MYAAFSNFVLVTQTAALYFENAVWRVSSERKFLENLERERERERERENARESLKRQRV